MKENVDLVWLAVEAADNGKEGVRNDIVVSVDLS